MLSTALGASYCRIDEIPGWRFIFFICPVFNGFFQYAGTFPFSWVDRYHRNAQFSRQVGDIHRQPFAAGHIEHGKGYDHRYFEIDDLGNEKQVALQVTGIGYQYDQVGTELLILLH